MVTAKDNSGRTKNTKRNITYGFIQVIISQVLPFIVRTILIYRFGVDYLGLNNLFGAILSVLSLMELGFGTAVVYSMYKPVAEGDTDQICAFLSYYRRIYRVIGFAMLVIGLMVMPFLKYLVHDPALPGDLNLYYCYLIFLGDAVLGYLLYGYMTAIPTAFQRTDLLSKVEMAASVLRCVIQSIILLTCTNFYLYLFSKPLITIGRNLMAAAVVTKMYPGLNCRGSITPAQKHDLNRKVYGVFVNKLTNISRNSIDSICISAFVGLTMTGMYNNYYIVVSAILAFSYTICSSMMPSVGNSIAVESSDKNYSDMRLFDFIYMMIAGWAAVCLVCLFQPFISVWIGRSMLLEMPVVLGLAAYFYILKAGDIRWVYHEGAGLWYECRFIMVGEAVANMILNILLCRILGVFGIILATVITVFVTNMILCPKLIFKSYFKNSKLNEYWADHMLYALTVLPTAVTSWLLCEKLLPMSMVSDDWLAGDLICLGGRLMICTLLSALVFWLFWHNSVRYEVALNWIKKLVRGG